MNADHHIEAEKAAGAILGKHLTYWSNKGNPPKFYTTQARSWGPAADRDHWDLLQDIKAAIVAAHDAGAKQAAERLGALMVMGKLSEAWQHWHDLGRMKPGTVPAPVLEAHTAAMLNPLCAEVMRGGGVE